MTHDEITAELSKEFPNVWLDDNPVFSANGVTVWRCTENSTHPWGKIANLALVDGTSFPRNWFERNLDVGLDAYHHPKDLSCVDYGWFGGYGKIGRAAIKLAAA